jgi:hypothetical protein
MLTISKNLNLAEEPNQLPAQSALENRQFAAE